MSFRFVLNQTALYIARLTLPWSCAHCRRTLDCLRDEGYCGPCWLRLPRIRGLVCWLCGLPLPLGGNRCFDCERRPRPFLIRAAALYSGGIRLGIHRFKYYDRIGMDNPFGTLLAQAWQDYPELQSFTLIAPVPLHPRKLRHRGFNQSLLLANELGKRIQLPVIDDLFWRLSDTVPQHLQNFAERQANLSASMIVNPRYAMHGLIKGTRVLLVDDIATSAATLSACYSALRRAGGHSLSALVLARDPSPSSGSLL